MKFFNPLVAIFKSYDYRDKVITLSAFAVFLLMIVKMLVFPYGLFGFGETGIYTEGIVAKNGIQNINPLFVDYNEADREVSALVFSGLMKYDLEKKAVVDDMAELIISEDKMEYSFVLREGLKWHDGNSVTIDDVYFTYHDVILSESFQNEILKTNFAGVLIDKVDEKTIKFTLEKPNVFFVSNFIIGILPEHVLGGTDPYDLLQDDFNKNPIGTGPYMVTEPVEVFSDGRTQITLERNPYYYFMQSEIEYHRFIVYPTMEELIEEINSVNGVVKVTGNYILDFQNNDRFELLPYELPQYVGVFMNMESEVLKDSAGVRLALQKAIDKEALISQFVDKIRVDTPLMELSQEDWEYQADIEQAQGALKESGYNYADEDTEHVGIRYHEDGLGLELRFIARAYDEGTYQYEETTKAVSFMQDAWESIGFSIQVEFLPTSLFKEAVMSRQYDLLLVGQLLGYNLDTYSYWHSTQANPLGQNLSNYKSFQVDSLIEDIRSTFDLEEREESLNDLAEKLKEDLPAIFLYRPIYYYATDGKLSGLSMDNVVYPGDRFSSIYLWTFD